MPAGGVQSGGASNDSGASVQRADAKPQIIQNQARVNENHLKKNKDSRTDGAKTIAKHRVAQPGSDWPM